MRNLIARRRAGLIIVLFGLLGGASRAVSGELVAGLEREGSLLIDRTGQYSFVIPKGWDLDQKSKAGDVRISTGGDRPYCWFLVIEASGLGAKEEFNMFKIGQKTVYKKVKIRKDSWRNLNGEWAGYLESLRTNDKGITGYAWNLVTARASMAYIIDCEASESEANQVSPFVKEVFDSFRWVLKP